MISMSKQIKAYHYNGIRKINRTYRNEQEGSSISRQNLNEKIETLRLAPTLFYHLPVFILKHDFLILILCPWGMRKNTKLNWVTKILIIPLSSNNFSRDPS